MVSAGAPAHQYMYRIASYNKYLLRKGASSWPMCAIAFYISGGRLWETIVSCLVEIPQNANGRMLIDVYLF